MDPQRLIDDYLNSTSAEFRRVAPGEWGLRIFSDAGSMDVGIRVQSGMVEFKAPAAAGSDEIDQSLILHWNRHTQLVRFGSTRGGEIWVHAEVPIDGLNEQMLDRILGLMIEAVSAARSIVGSNRSDQEGNRPRGPGGS